jgi:hypothetical protein
MWKLTSTYLFSVSPAGLFRPTVPDLYNTSELKPQMDAADEVVSQLFPHQMEALAWMIQRENSNALPPFWLGTQTPGGLVYKNR